MKRRYNHETSQWDIVLREQDYYQMINELEMLRRTLSSQIKPTPSLLPSFRKCGNSMCNCSGACFMEQFQRNQPVQTWSSTLTNGVN